MAALSSPPVFADPVDFMALDEYHRPVYAPLPSIEVACPTKASHPPIRFSGPPPDAQPLTLTSACGCTYPAELLEMVFRIGGMLLAQLIADRGVTWESLRIPYPPGPPPGFNRALDGLRFHRRGRPRPEPRRLGLADATANPPSPSQARRRWGDPEPPYGRR